MFDELKVNNVYCSELTRVKSIINQPFGEFGDNIEAVRALINAETNRFEVGVLISHDNPGHLHYTFKLNGTSFKVPMSSPYVEPVVYPLLFPFGEDGWHQGLAQDIPYMQYMASRFLMPERDSESSSGYLERMNKAGTKLLPTNRFQLMSRLGQHFAVEGVSRAVDSRLNFIRSNKGFIRGNYSHVNDEHADIEFTAAEVDSERVELNDSSKSFLNASITGSPRHLKNLAKNGLQIVSEKGKPHCFLTLTANPEWPEIQERLFPGQTAYDR